MMIDCKHASRLISQRMDAGLGLRERLQLRLHLAICDTCASVQRQMELLRRAMQRLL